MKKSLILLFTSFLIGCNNNVGKDDEAVSPRNDYSKDSVNSYTVFTDGENERIIDEGDVFLQWTAEKIDIVYSSDKSYKIEAYFTGEVNIKDDIVFNDTHESDSKNDLSLRVSEESYALLPIPVEFIGDSLDLSIFNKNDTWDMLGKYEGIYYDCELVIQEFCVKYSPFEFEGSVKVSSVEEIQRIETPSSVISYYADFVDGNKEITVRKGDSIFGWTADEIIVMEESNRVNTIIARFSGQEVTIRGRLEYHINHESTPMRDLYFYASEESNRLLPIPVGYPRIPLRLVITNEEEVIEMLGGIEGAYEDCQLVIQNFGLQYSPTTVEDYVTVISLEIN